MDIYFVATNDPFLDRFFATKKEAENYRDENREVIDMLIRFSLKPEPNRKEIVNLLNDENWAWYEVVIWRS